jgi:hypothetical protein
MSANTKIKDICFINWSFLLEPFGINQENLIWFFRMGVKLLKIHESLTGFKRFKRLFSGPGPWIE